MEVPALLLALDDVSREDSQATPSASLVNSDPLIVTTSGTNGSEKPFLLLTFAHSCIVASELAQLLAGLDTQFDAAIPEHHARLALMDLRIHLQRGE